MTNTAHESRKRKYMNSELTEKTESRSADLVIIGSGGGLAAALAAAESGVKNIVVLEKQGKPGGNTRLAGDIFACESPVQERQGIQTHRDEFFKMAMRWAHWNHVDPRIIRAFVDKSGDTIRWLMDHGIDFEEIIPERKITTHNAVGGNNRIMKVIAKKCEALGVRILLGVSGKKILQEADGRISGVLAEDKNGISCRIGSRAVMIATGGFPGNIEMMKQYCPDYHDGMQVGRWPHHTGDGLVMAREIGAGISDTVFMFHLGPVLETGYWARLSFIPYVPDLVWLNKKGRRFADEAWPTHWESGNAVLCQPDRTVFLVWDDGKNREMNMEIPVFATEFQKAVSGGSAIVSEDWQGIAEFIGADPAVVSSSMEEYNRVCGEKLDPVFAKNPKFLTPMTKAPFYAVKAITHCGETMGGIKVNERMEVLDPNTEPIAGLYAVGVITEGWSSQTYCSDMFGSACSFALNSGRIGGESVAEYLLKQIPAA
jgi:fumarate reductase flavoprotein subunit